MKIVFSGDERFGTQRFAEGDEADLPDKFAQALIAAGKATAASDKPVKKAKEYKNRQIKAEDSD